MFIRYYCQSSTLHTFHNTLTTRRRSQLLIYAAICNILCNQQRMYYIIAIIAYSGHCSRINVISHLYSVTHRFAASKRIMSPTIASVRAESLENPIELHSSKTHYYSAVILHECSSVLHQTFNNHYRIESGFRKYR